MSDITQPAPESISELELCIMLKKSTRSLSYWRHEGVAPKYYKEGRCIRYLMSDVEDFIKNHDPRIKLDLR